MSQPSPPNSDLAAHAAAPVSPAGADLTSPDPEGTGATTGTTTGAAVLSTPYPGVVAATDPVANSATGTTDDGPSASPVALNGLTSNPLPPRLSAPTTPVALSSGHTPSSHVSSQTYAPATTPEGGILVDQTVKKPRPPLPLPKLNGPSLLTQALASARGIQTFQNEQHRPEQTTTQSGAGSTSAQPTGVGEPRPTQPADEPHDDSTSRSDGGSLLTSKRSIHNHFNSNNPSASSTSPGTNPRHVRAATHNPSRTASMTGTATMVRSHRDFLAGSRGRGRSLERTEKEIRIHQLDTSSATSTNIGDTALSHSVVLQPQGGKLPAEKAPAAADPRVQYRSWRTDRTLSMGPEKIWSIGSGDASGTQNGLVEMSITEVLAGVEPTRSRKASHSLRFFKEGLPEDVGRRRDSRSTVHPRERLVLAKDSKAEQIYHQTVEYPGGFSSPCVSPRTVADADQSVFNLATQRISGSAVAVETPSDDGFDRDYFTTEKISQEPRQNLNLDKAPANASVSTARRDVASDVTDPGSHGTQEPRRRSDESTDGTEHGEEMDDSGEEKISSAVFLPHQGVEGSPEATRVASSNLTAGVQNVAGGPADADGFHPWLVKADEDETQQRRPSEPHADDIARRGLDIGQARQQRAASQPKEALVIQKPLSLPERPLTRPTTVSRPVADYYDEIVHDHQLSPTQPLEAIELIPYKHQVGGHTTLWRFSKRAVCKQLNNRENEFYERIEHYHRDLLPFLPRYIGVLNVTFQKQPRRRSTVKRDDGQLADKKVTDSDPVGNGVDGRVPRVLSPTASSGDAMTHHRVISQSLQGTQIPIPTVSFDDNRHILPRSLLQPDAVHMGYPSRQRNDSDAFAQHATNRSNEAKPDQDDPRSTLGEYRANSWGATTVNKKLRNEVFNDAFLNQPVKIQRHQRPSTHQRSMVRRPAHPVLAAGKPEPSIVVDYDTTNSKASTKSEDEPTTALAQSQSDLTPLTSGLLVDPTLQIGDVTGTSAPEATLMTEFPQQQRRKRRFSGGGLRRRPETVTEERGERGDLMFYEDADDAGYGGDSEATFLSPRGTTAEGSRASSPGKPINSLPMPFQNHTAVSSAAVSELPSPALEVKKIPRPINPKEARAQKDTRVEYFLLLEDLTAGMKRPCIMDLKMGTRQYGVEANHKKRDSQRRKCAATTSRELGVRVCGLQAWDAKKQTYVFKDKYYGRDLKAGHEFQDALTRFLYDGIDKTSILKHIPTILRKLSQLEVTIRKLRGYRFYAASLLMFYDGDQSEYHDMSIDDSTTDVATDVEDTWEARRRRADKKEIDFKMADFANSVTAGDMASGKPCPPQHPNEPDNGFLRGLASLRKYFLKIQRDVRKDLGIISRGRQDDDDEDDLEVGDDEDGNVSE